MFPDTPAVGKGTFEVWMAGPLECDDVRGVKMISSRPPITKVTKGKDTDAEFAYYNFAPDGYLPETINASVTWEFITFEKYAFWDGLKAEKYDKASDLYKTYTRLEDPINTHPMLKRQAQSCIPEDNPDDYRQTALNCYNYVVTNFDYDFADIYNMQYAGLQHTTPSFRAWENKSGICDEFANVLVSMLREAGIPSRPVAGFVHSPTLEPGGHAWAEFYLPGAGWVPMDPTWAQEAATIDEKLSTLGNKRELKNVDYYFGKHDPYRIVLFKDWNYTLNPVPQTPGAKKSNVFMVGFTDRFSGVNSVVNGWMGVPGIAGTG